MAVIRKMNLEPTAEKEAIAALARERIVLSKQETQEGNAAIDFITAKVVKGEESYNCSKESILSVLGPLLYKILAYLLRGLPWKSGQQPQVRGFPH